MENSLYEGVNLDVLPIIMKNSEIQDRAEAKDKIKIKLK